MLQAIGDISIEARTRNERLNQQLNILAPQNRELTARLQQLESTDREQEIQRLQQITIGLQREVRAKVQEHKDLKINLKLITIFNL